MQKHFFCSAKSTTFWIRTKRQENKKELLKMARDSIEIRAAASSMPSMRKLVATIPGSPQCFMQGSGPQLQVGL